MVAIECPPPQSFITAPLCPPACRTVAVYVWIDPRDPGVSGHAIYPLLAIREIPDRDGNRSRDFPEFEAVIVIDGCLDSHRSLTRGVREKQLESCNLVACPWPPEQDEARLAPRVEAELTALHELAATRRTRALTDEWRRKGIR